MIETKIKCDGHGYSYSYDRNEGVSLSEAASAHWYQIQVTENSILISRPTAEQMFSEKTKHACKPSHARAVVEAMALELIPDEIEDRVSGTDR